MDEPETLLPKRWITNCPACGDKGAVGVNSHLLLFRCFSCQTGGSWDDLARMFHWRLHHDGIQLEA